VHALGLVLLQEAEKELKKSSRPWARSLTWPKPEIHLTYGDYMRRYAWLVVFCICAMAVLVTTATAQSSIAATSCSDYRNTTDPAKQAQYAAYLQAYSNATSPDPRYVRSDAALAEDAKQISDWCGKNGKRTYGEAVAAIMGSASSGAGAPAAAAAPAAPPPEPTSCKVGATKGCAGCSITCTGGAQATCNAPRDSGIKDDQGNPECAVPAWCFCKKPKK
jgi:hypothetical protein